MAVGFGYDIHRLVVGRKLVLGGLEIPHPRGLLGHSDGDVLLHAVIDALLGAAGLGDIGKWFPDTDPAIKDMPSEAMLARVMDQIRPKWVLENVDVTVIAEEPKIAPHRAALVQRLAERLGCPHVSIKAKTHEGLGPIGAKEAIACYAVVELRAR